MEGFRYIFHHKRLLATLLSKAGLGFMGANYIILSIYGERVFRFQSGAMLGMSLLMGARGVGSLLGPILAGSWAGGDQPPPPRHSLWLPRRRRRIRSSVIRPGYLHRHGLRHLGTRRRSHHLGLLHHHDPAPGRGPFRGRVFSADFAFLVMAMTVSTWIAGSAVDLGATVRHVSLWVGLLILAPPPYGPCWRCPCGKTVSHDPTPVGGR
ncbi:MAG: hypothetical protein R2762_11980 [Bryobacteraceae bacterium]